MEPLPAPRGPRRAWTGWLVRLAIAAALLILLFWRVHAREIAARLSAADPFAIMAALGLGLTSLGIGALRWRCVAAAVGMRGALRVRTLFRHYLVSQFYALL